MLWFLLACFAEHRRSGPTPREQAWARADQALFAEISPSAESEPAQLTAAMDLAEGQLLAVLAAAPRDMRAAGWLARISWFRGSLARTTVGGEEDAARHFRTSAEQSASCFRMEPGFSATYEADASRYTPFNLAALPKPAYSCLIWAMAAGTALVDVRGPGALASLEELPLLLVRARYVQPEDPDGWTAWVEGRLSALKGEDGLPFLTKAIEKDPGSSLFRAELALRYPEQKSLPEGTPRPAPAWETIIAHRLIGLGGAAQEP